MKVRFLDAAFINNVYYKKGEIAELNIDKCPRCAEVIEVKVKEKTENKEEEKQKQEQNDNALKIQNKVSDELIKEKLEELLNKAFEKEILLEGTENMTVEEQIEKLEELLKGE